MRDGRLARFVRVTTPPARSMAVWANCRSRVFGLVARGPEGYSGRLFVGTRVHIVRTHEPPMREREREREREQKVVAV